MKKILFIIFILVSGVGSAYPPYNKKTIRVAIIDTGFDFKSKWEKLGKDADGNQLRVPKLCKEGHKDFTGNGLQDEMGHGTHVAGIVAKFAEDSNYCLVIIKYYVAGGAKNLENSIKALEYASDIDIDMINYSGGGVEFSFTEYKVIKKLLDKGTIIVAAAGNEGKANNYRLFKIDEKERMAYFINTLSGEVTTTHPTAYFPADDDPRIIVVANVTINNKTHKEELANSSNGGDAINFKEKGTNILSLLPNNRTGYMTGTSQSSPTRVGKMIKMWKNK